MGGVRRPPGEQRGVPRLRGVDVHGPAGLAPREPDALAEQILVKLTKVPPTSANNRKSATEFC